MVDDERLGLGRVVTPDLTLAEWTEDRGDTSANEVDGPASVFLFDDGVARVNSDRDDAGEFQRVEVRSVPKLRMNVRQPGVDEVVRLPVEGVEDGSRSVGLLDRMVVPVDAPPNRETGECGDTVDEVRRTADLPRSDFDEYAVPCTARPRDEAPDRR